jgi:hypothetical protein
MKFFTYAVVDNKTAKILVKPRMVYVKDKKTLEYMALKAVPKPYAKKLDCVEILIRDEFPSYNPTYSPTTSVGSTTLAYPIYGSTVGGATNSYTVTASNIK